MFKSRKKDNILLIGLALGVGYALLTRFVYGEKATLVTLSYLFLVPAVLGVIPLVFANDEQIKSYRNIIFIPWITVATSFLFMCLLGWEESLCFLVLGGPFFIAATVGALIYRFYRIYKDNKRITLIVVVFIPFLFSFIEDDFNNPTQKYTVVSEVTINNNQENIWNNIIRVPVIKDEEYSAGIFNKLGVPKPIKADLTENRLGALRTGYFEGGLKFDETVTLYQQNKKITFSIIVDSQTIRNRVFDKHVLQGNYFSFVDASYELEECKKGIVKLKLISSYRLTSKVNFYNKFWGDIFLKDFQDRLLAVIKKRCDKY